MSAAFALQPSGPPAPCSYPKCTLQAFHDGDHLFAQKPDNRLAFPGPHYYRCVICGTKMVEYSDPAHTPSTICDSPACMAEFCRRHHADPPVSCGCPQRPYAHDLAIHKSLRSESYNPERRFVYPWSLCMSERRELSTERE
jgi:hypothetical protein